MGGEEVTSPQLAPLPSLKGRGNSSTTHPCLYSCLLHSLLRRTLRPPTQHSSWEQQASTPIPQQNLSICSISSLEAFQASVSPSVK